MIWVNLVKRLWPEEAETFLDYCAHMIQKPEEKCNWACILSGKQGIGKDTVLAPLRAILGHGNVGDTSPDGVLSAYHPWVQNLLLVVSETAPTDKDHSAIAFYNKMKTVITAPPEHLVYTQKYEKERCVVNVIRVFITTNHYESLFIPKDDRRMFIMHSKINANWHIEADVPEFFENQGQTMRAEDVCAWLMKRDLSKFNAGSPPMSTAAKSMIIDLWEGEADDDMTKALDLIGRPDVFFPSELQKVQFDGHKGLDVFLTSPPKMLHRMRKSGYVPVKPLEYGKARNRWEFIGADKVTKVLAAKAWVKEELADDLEAARALITMRGQNLVAGKALLKVV
jgi:hypothetical protein